MIRIYSSNKGTFDIPDTLLQALGTLVGQRFAAIQSVDFDESESAPVLEDTPEDPEVVIAQLNARILELEAELEEHKRSVDRVLEAIRPLGTAAEPSVGFDTIFLPGAPTVDNGTTNPDPRR
jgi:Fe-S-cluster formation regulator IscX/YfhJ